MTTPQMHLNDVLTGETVTRDFTVDETTEFKALQAAEKLHVKQIADDATARATAQKTILDRLGLTVDELKTLIG